MKVIRLFVLAWLVPVVLQGQPQEVQVFQREASNPAQRFSMASQYPAEERSFVVHTPRGYDKRTYRQYPVLYLLDGAPNLKHTVMTSNLLAERREMPEIIVVAIPNASRDIRSRDYSPPSKDERGASSGGAESFLDFLEKELIPRIEKEYRTEPFRMIAGHSMGGLLAVHSLVTRPDLFQAYFAFSPALKNSEDGVIERAKKVWMERSTGTEQAGRKSFLYLNLGGKEAENITAAYHRMVEVLETHAPPELKWHAGPILADDSHSTTPLAGQYLGFRTLFTHWAIPRQDFATRGLEAVEEHFRMLTAELGYEIVPEERLLNSNGYLFLKQERPEEALELLRHSAALYPQSANAADSLADVLSVLERTEEARIQAARAVSLAQEQGHPGLESFSERLTALTGQD